MTFGIYRQTETPEVVAKAKADILQFFFTTDSEHVTVKEIICQEFI